MKLAQRALRLVWPLFLLATDALTAAGALLLAALLRRSVLPRIYGGFPAWPDNFHLPAFIYVFIFVLLIANAFEGLYNRLHTSTDEWRHLWRAVFITCLIFLALVTLGAAASQISRTMVMLTGLLLLVMLPVQRYLCRNFFSRMGWLREPVLLIATPTGEQGVRRLVENHFIGGLTIAACEPPETFLDAGDRLNAELERCLLGSGARSVFISAEGLSADAVERLAVAASARVVVTRVLPGENSAPLAGMETEYYLRGEAVGLTLHAARLTRPGYRVIKVLFDRSLGMIISLLCLPLLALIALWVKLDSRGPVFYRQRRLGLRGEPFAVFKFRTMEPDAEKRLDKLLQRDPDLADQWSRRFKLDDDPRITRAGRWLRRTSLDELPQLINVLAGDMSLVGPRPIVEAEMAMYGPAYEDYCRLRPGLTGLWQVSGRSETSYARRVFLDQWYLRYWSPWLDLTILARTALVVLRREGAR